MHSELDSPSQPGYAVEGRAVHVSARNEVRGDIGAANLSALIEEVGAAIEPERLAHISLGQENPRMRMNAAPG